MGVVVNELGGGGWGSDLSANYAAIFTWQA